MQPIRPTTEVIRRRCLVFAAALIATLVSTAPVRAAITFSGSTSANPTVDNADPIIGIDNTGRLNITGGSLVTSDVAVLGGEVNGIGLVSISDVNTVTGLTSGWVVNAITIGDEGTGRLEILDGAVLNLHFFISPGTGDFTVGNAADSLGTVIVNGLGSMLRLGDDSFIGVNGSALMRIEDEGYVIGTNDAVSGSDVFTVGPRGRVELDNGRLRTESLINNGAIVGHGRVDSELAITNSTSGRFEVQGSERMVVNAVVDNDGEIALVGGEIEFLDPVTNSNAAANVTIRDGGIVRFPETGFGLDTTSGVLASTGGVNDIYGTVRIQGAGSKIVVAGESTAVFHDPVTNNGGVLEVFPGSTPVFLQGLTTTQLVAGAPTLSVHLADPTAEPGPGMVEVVGTAQLAGDLDITLASGFNPLPGDRFTVLSSGGLSGTFDGVNTTNPASGIQFFPIHTATDVEVFATAVGETTWAVDADGQASLGANWFGGVAPGGIGDAAAFTTMITANRTITLDAPLTLGTVAFDDDNNYALQGSTLTLQAAGLESANIDVRNAHGNGAHTIVAPVALVSDLVINQRSTGTLTIAGALNNSAGRTITKTGAGSVILAGAQTHGIGAKLHVTQGTMTINTDAGAVASRNLAITANSSLTFGSTQHLAALNIGATGAVQLTAGGAKNLVTGAVTVAGGATPTGTLDLTNNAAVVDFPTAGPNPTATIRSQILAGRGGPGFGATWTGPGITSSTAAADVATAPESHSLGYAVNGDLPLGPFTNFRGEPVDASAVLIRYTRTGDANLDGIVNDDDVTILGAFYAPGVANANWAAGDFDYNGFVDDDDVTLLGAFYDPSAPPLAVSPIAATTVSAVPEPSAVTLLGVILAGLAIAAVRRKYVSRPLLRHAGGRWTERIYAR